MARGFEAQLKEPNRARLAPIIPVVLYHGQRPWTAPCSLARWLDLPEAAHELLKPYLPDFAYLLETRRGPDPESYKGPDTVRFVRLLFDHARERDFIARLGAWHAVIRRLDAQAGRKDDPVPVIGLLVDYVYRLAEDVHEPLVAALEAIRAHNLKDLAMDTYHTTLKKGREEGRVEGEQLGLAKGFQLGRAEGEQHGLARGEQLGLARGEQLGLARALVRICEKRFGVLASDLRARIDAADLDTLSLWTERAAVSESLDEVLAPTPH